MLTIATAVVRAWTRLYTWRVSADACESRRAEIESDLWESVEESRLVGSDWRAAAQIIARLVVGIPDDVAWHFEQAPRERAARRRPVPVYIGAAAVIAVTALCALIVFSRLEPVRSIPAPPPPPGNLVLIPPPPPPPPPPTLRGRTSN